MYKQVCWFNHLCFFIFFFRKRKCKRLALDPDAPSTSNPQGPSGLPPGISNVLPVTKSSSFCGVSVTRRKKALKSSPDTENRY